MEEFNNELLQLVYDLRHDFSGLYKRKCKRKPTDGCVNLITLVNEAVASDLALLFREQRKYTLMVIEASFDLDSVIPNNIISTEYGWHPFLTGTGFEYNEDNEDTIRTDHHTLLTSSFNPEAFNEWIDGLPYLTCPRILKKVIKTLVHSTYEEHKYLNNNSLDYAYIKVIEKLCDVFER